MHGEKQVIREAKWVHAYSSVDSISRADRSGVPEPVRTYLEWAGATGRPPIEHVRVRHGGTFRMRLDGKWWPIVGDLHLTPEPPARVWNGSIKPFPFISVQARDSYQDQHGRLVIRAFSRIPIGDVTGPEMDTSGLVTVLAELPLVPSALVPSARLRWEAIDQSSARATLRDGALSVSGVFYFAPDGRIERFESNDRYRHSGDTAVRTRWIAYYRLYEEVEGWDVPVQFDAAWQLDGRAVSYARFDVTSIEFDRPAS